MSHEFAEAFRNKGFRFFDTQKHEEFPEMFFVTLICENRTIKVDTI